MPTIARKNPTKFSQSLHGMSYQWVGSFAAGTVTPYVIVWASSGHQCNSSEVGFATLRQGRDSRAFYPIDAGPMTPALSHEVQTQHSTSVTESTSRNATASSTFMPCSLASAASTHLTGAPHSEHDLRAILLNQLAPATTLDPAPTPWPPGLNFRLLLIVPRLSRAPGVRRSLDDRAKPQVSRYVPL